MRLTAFPPILRSRRAARAACIACALVFATQAHAEGKVRIVDQFGIGSLLLKVAKDQKLIEKEGAKEGLAIDVQWSELSGGAAVNDTLESLNAQWLKPAAIRILAVDDVSIEGIGTLTNRVTKK